MTRFSIPCIAILASLLALLFSASAAPVPRQSKPAAFYLAGDSTTAPNGGWGDAFLAQTLKNGATGTNFAKSGRTTKSFRDGGYWTQVLDAVKSNAASKTPVVTIQFGHNDQKENSGVTQAQFLANLKTMASEVKSAGGIPILVTPLTRRTFSGGKVVENLSNEARLTIQAANESGVDYIDLNKASTAYINAIGSANANTYNLASGDYTHLNTMGATVFANMVSWLLDQTQRNGSFLSGYTAPKAAAVSAFQAGTYWTG